VSAKIEHVYPRLILHWMGVEEIPGKDFAKYLRKLDDGLQADLSFNSLGPGKSWNIPQMRMSARVLNPVLLRTEREDLYRWWKIYFMLQLGLDVPVEPTPSLLSFFDGNEPFGYYVPWRWGGVGGARFAAQRDGRQDIVDLCDRWLRVAAAVAEHMSAPDPDMVRQKNRKRQLFDNCRHVSPVGERGASGHDITDTRILLALWNGEDRTIKRWDWPAKAFMACGTKAVVSAEPHPIYKCRWWSEQHVLHFPSGRLVYKPRRRNWNTPCYFFDWYSYEKKTAVLGHPWPEGRGWGLKGEGWCGITTGPAQGRKYIVAKTEYCQTEQMLPDEPILSHVVFGPDGFKELVQDLNFV
jgi:hypothetical protein